MFASALLCWGTACALCGARGGADHLRTTRAAPLWGQVSSHPLELQQPSITSSLAQEWHKEWEELWPRKMHMTKLKIVLLGFLGS